MIRVSGKSPKIFKNFILFLGALGAVLYPVLFSPFMDPEPYRNIQAESRKNIRREDIQPGNMNIWSNPFLKSNNKGEKQ